MSAVRVRLSPPENNNYYFLFCTSSSMIVPNETFGSPINRNFKKSRSFKLNKYFLPIWFDSSLQFSSGPFPNETFGTETEKQFLFQINLVLITK
jgi:hypothetical protein